MSEEELQKRINSANDRMVTDATEAEEVVETPQGTDLFEEQRTKMHEAKTRPARGAMPRMKLDLSILEQSPITSQYKKAKDDCDYYTSIGNRQYASMIKQQYMQDQFLPIVDALVKLNGVGAVQTNPEMLAKLDSLTLLNGTRGAGYTKSLLNTLYATEEAVERSDQQVKHAVREIKRLAEADQIRSAVGKASDIKKHIDQGENVATPEDYELIQRVALYGT